MDTVLGTTLKNAVPYSAGFSCTVARYLFARGYIHPLVYHQLCQQKDKYFNLVKNMLVFLATFCYSEINRNLEKKLCTDRSMEVKFPVLSGNYDRQTIRPTDVLAEVSLPIIAFLKYVCNAIGDVRGPNAPFCDYLYNSMNYDVIK